MVWASGWWSTIVPAPPAPSAWVWSPNRPRTAIRWVSPDTKERMANVGSTLEELAQHIKKELAIRAKVVKAADIRVD